MDRVERLSQTYTQAPWRTQLQIVGLFSLGVVFIALVAGYYLNVTARAAKVGREIQDLQNKIAVLQQENSDLQAQLGMLTSASVMNQRALSLGFRPVTTDETTFLVVSGYPGRQPVILAPYSAPRLVGAPVLPAEYTESLFTWLERQIRIPSFSFFKGLR